MPSLARRLASVTTSGTAAIFGQVSALRAKNVDVVSLSVGETDYATPAHVIEAAARAMRDGATRYTDVAGCPALRDAIAEESARRRGLRYERENIVVAAGAKQVLYTLAQALYDPGDRVLVPSPCWGSYVQQACLFGAEVTLLPCRPDQCFVPCLSELEQALTVGAKALVLCAPNNPTGAVFSRAYLTSLGALLAEHDCWIVVDEIYGHLCYEPLGDAPSLLEVAPHLSDRLLIVDGVSKAYAMTGFRVGWLLGPRPVVAAVERLLGQSTTNVASVSQAAALAALTGDQGCIAGMRDGLRARRDYLVQGLSQIDGFDPLPVPAGAFYVFADVRGLLELGHAGRYLCDDVELARWLLDEAGVAVVPGTAFFAPGYVRFSYAQDLDRIDEGLRRIRSAVAHLDRP